MGYLGNRPAEAYSAFQKQDFTTSATTSYTLDNKVANENEIALFINFVRQEPTTAYTASNNTLTLSSATSASDDMYCVYLGKAVQTVNPPSGSVGTTQLADSSVTSAKLSYPLTTFSSTGIDDNGDATAMTITSDEKIGIGETVPLGQLHVKSGDSGVSSPDITDLVVECSGSGGISLLGGTGGQVEIAFGDSGDANIGRFAYNNASNFLATVVNASEVMRINANGNIMIGNTTESARLHISSSTSAGTDPLVVFSDSGGTTCGSIDLNASGNTVAYVTSSDYRLKENVSYDFDATSRLKQLKPARFNFIADPDTTVDGFIAHEVSSIVPEAITKTKDAVKVWKDNEVLPEGVSVGDNKLDENGNTIPDYQGIDQSKLIPLLVKTIQELEARITTLENA